MQGAALAESTIFDVTAIYCGLKLRCRCKLLGEITPQYRILASALPPGCHWRDNCLILIRQGLGRARVLKRAMLRYPPRRSHLREARSMSLIIYLIGFAFVIGGIAWALIVAGVSTLHVMIVTVILVGVAILTGVTRTRTRD